MVQSLSTIRDYFLVKFPWRVALVVFLVALVGTWMYFSPNGFLGKADAIGYAVCHRIGSRSFFIGDTQFSVCARCTGQYLGAVLGILFLMVFRRYRSERPPWFVIGILLVWGIVYVVDGFNSFLHLIPGTERLWLYEPSNSLRLITGFGVGLGISIMLFPAFNQTIWKRTDRRPILDGMGDFGVLVILALVLIVLILRGNPIVLYPLSLISAGGVLLLLTMVYSMVWVMVFRVEGSFFNFRQYFFPLLAGFSTALIQILIIDLFRYLATGTWGEFLLG
ncbi:DUF2085 domain-containing protein [Chloroflexota bacterium]